MVINYPYKNSVITEMYELEMNVINPKMAQ